MNSSMHICDNLLGIGWDLFEWNGSSILMKTLHSSPSLILAMLFHFIPFWYICSIQAGIFSWSMKVLGLQCRSLMFIPVLEALIFLWSGDSWILTALLYFLSFVLWPSILWRNVWKIFSYLEWRPYHI